MSEKAKNDKERISLQNKISHCEGKVAESNRMIKQMERIRDKTYQKSLDTFKARLEELNNKQ